MTYRVPVYVGCKDVTVCVCSMSYRRWTDQKKCEGAVKDPRQDKCWFESEGVCRKREMEHEGA